MLRTLSIISLAAAAAACATNRAETSAPYGPVAPAEAGFSADGLAALDAHFAQQVADGVRAGYVIGVARNGRLVHTFATGMADIDSGRAMDLDTRFRLASMTKPVTVAAVLSLVDAGTIDVDDSVSVYVPLMANMLVAESTTANAEGGFDAVPQDPPMTVRHLLTHTSGLGYALGAQSDLDQAYLANTLYDGDGDLQASINQLTSLPLYSQPGEQWFYSWAIDVLGRVVEVASGIPFEDYLQEEIFDPLGMTATHFYSDPQDAALLATVYGHDADGGFVAAQNVTFGSGDETFPSGGGGLISTLPDYLRFAAMLANGGTLDGERILSPEAVAMMGSAQIPASAFPRPSTFGGTFLGWGTEGRSFGYGVQVTTDADETPQVDFDGDFGWSGAYSTDFFASPETGVAAVIMVQSQGGPNRPPADLPGDLRERVFGAMTE